MGVFSTITTGNLKARNCIVTCPKNARGSFGLVLRFRALVSLCEAIMFPLTFGAERAQMGHWRHGAEGRGGHCVFPREEWGRRCRRACCELPAVAHMRGPRAHCVRFPPNDFTTAPRLHCVRVGGG